MGEANFSSSYPYPLTFQVTVPGNGGGVAGSANIYSLLTTGQKAILDSAMGNGLKVMAVQATPTAAVNYYHANLSSAGPWTVDSTNAGGFPIGANQKPNEIMPVTDGDKRLFFLSQSASTVPMSVTLYCVAKDMIG